MTLREAASDFRRAHEYAPWLQGVGHADYSHGDVTRSKIVAYTYFAVPEPLKAKLAHWYGWPVVFQTVGRICLN